MIEKLSDLVKNIRDDNHKEYYEAVADILEHPVVKRMSEYNHHYGTSCYRHCLHVSYMNYVICKKLGLDAVSAARAGMLHDLFLYDWHTRAKETGNYFHGLTHPRHAMKMADKNFELSKMEKEIILHHMWPITITPPTSKEGLITTITDKVSGLLEAGDYYYEKITGKQMYKVQ